MPEMLQEYADSRGVAVEVDRQAGVIRGVKILGLESRNGRTYLPEALAEAAPLYERAKVNVNHPKGCPNAPRDYQDRIGVIRGAAVRPGEGLFGDLHFNPKHAMAEQLIWDAEHLPENVGFSHNVEARTSRNGDQVIVEAILRVQSVDLVADPATTRGLFESFRCGTACSPPEGGLQGTCKCLSGGEQAVAREPLADLALEELKRQRPDLVEALAQEAAAELARLRAEVDRYQAAESVRQKQVRVGQLLKEFHLPDPERAQGWAKLLVSEQFVQSLLQSPDEAAMRRLVEDRAALARSMTALASSEPPDPCRPLSRDQFALGGPAALDTRAFVEAIT
jgi:hypothetical protein